MIETAQERETRQLHRSVTTPLRPSRRLVVLSNRAPVRIVHDDDDNEQVEPTIGGGGTTFLRLLEKHGGTWIAWPGGRTRVRRVALPEDKARFDLVFVNLSERDVSQYYYGMCNQGLWPLMHYMTPICHFNRVQWVNYQRVNMDFASTAAVEAAPDSAVWIQDYHLALVPRMFRARRPELPIGMFWHVPFPPEQVFRVFPWRREFLAGMLGSDLIGFHIRPYQVQFENACEKILGAEVDRARGEIRFENRTTRVGAFPLGIQVDYYEQLATSPRVDERVKRLRRSFGADHHIVLGVDRLDYTKGIPQRILGFERFLEQNPSYHRRVSLVLVAVPSRTRIREYSDLKREIDEQVGRVIGRFSNEGWVPIRYLYTELGPEELVSYYQASDIALLTPLRDGMNLVAKEYIASRSRDDGVMILSEFAGAAEEMTEALLVNPYDIDQIAIRIKEALEMSPAAKAERIRALKSKIRKNHLEQWSAAFLSALTGGLELEEHAVSDRAAV